MLIHRASPRGFSLIEFMIAITVSLILLAALTSTFVANSRARTELDRANQQIENGRYALSVLTDDLQIAGYVAEFNLRTAVLAAPGAKPRPCANTVAEWIAALPMHLQGYDNIPDADANGGADVDDVDDDATGAVDLDCLPATDVRPGTDIMVVRHASVCTLGSTNCPTAIAGAPYFQAANCATQIAFADQTDPNLPAIPNSRASYRLDTTLGNLNRQLRNCGTAAPVRRYLVHIYFVANNDQAGDGIPTLKRAELTGVGGNPGFQLASIANGIEDFQVEYGIDCGDAPPAPPGKVDCTGTSDGAPDVYAASPDTYNRADITAPTANCAADYPNCVQNWLDTTSIKVSILARNLNTTRDYVNSKVYSLGRNAAGTAQCALFTDPTDFTSACAAFDDGFRRHVYQTAIRLTNPAVRRE